ncbi:MAG: thioredoxin family protein [Cyanobacteria bacterium]|nr:thioredoxin family protein [Cyanobacteriota bacterium]
MVTLMLPAFAGTEIPFTQASFESAKAADKYILVDVYAPWCPFCARQQRVISELQNDAQFKELVVFRLDFDHQKDELRTLKANRQSTLIVFHGKTEKGRLTWATRTQTIRTLLESAFK